jgi:hypothetical protein
MTYNTKYQIYHVAFSEKDIKRLLLFSDLLEMRKKRQLDSETYIWKKGMKKWIEAGKIPELKPLFAVPPAVPDELKEESQLFD